MPISCDIWPMNLLTKPTGEKDRALIVHPKPAVERKGISRIKGLLTITDPKAVKIKDGIYIPEFKEAGHRHFFCRGAKGYYHMYGRRLNVNQTYTDIWPKLKGIDYPELPLETVVDMELLWPGHHDSEVTTAIKECPDQLVMRCFSVPIYKGVLLIEEDTEDWVHGRIRLHHVVGKERCVKAYKPITIAGDNKKFVIQILLRIADHKGFEGYVLKEFANRNWWKLKGIQEADVFVVGFKISNAETRKGMVTAVKVGVYDDNKKMKKIGNVSGFNLDEMEAMTEAYIKYRDDIKNPFLGKVLRIRYQELAGRGGLKHAFRDCWRDDKSPNSCSINQFK